KLPLKTSRAAKVLRLVPRLSGGAASLFGVLIVVAWHARWRPVLQMVPGSAPIQFNTALCFILSGTGLFLLKPTPSRPPRWLGAFVVFFTVLTLVEYASGWDFGVDLLFFRPY